jgi:histidyl-tRNA synthetase
MSTTDKVNRLQARLPRGFADRGPADIAATQRMIDRVRAVYELYGFEPVETPMVEYSDALGKFLPDQNRPNEGVFSFKDDDDQWLSLRYDLTAPLARFVAANFDSLPKPYRSYRFGWVFRNEKPGPGRFRQFLQFDADTVGSASPAADAEMCMMAADTIEALGAPRGSYVVKCNNRKIFDGLLEAIGLQAETSAGQRMTVLRAIDKLDRLGLAGVHELLGKGRRDESGDFTKGAELSGVQIRQVISYLEQAVSYDQRITELTAARQPISPAIDQSYFLIEDTGRSFYENDLSNQGVRELEEIRSLVRSCGYESDRFRIDPAVVRGLEYYTGAVYEVALTLEDRNGQPTRFGSVGGGGRYDGLVARFGREAVPATGFSLGVSRLLAALEHLGKLEARPEPGPVIVTVLDRDRLADYQRMVARLREAGIRAELYLGAGKFGPQMKYADRRRAPCVVIQGSNERAQGVVEIKDMIEGAKAAAAIGSNQEWRQARGAQFAVAEDQLIEAVREVLSRHAAERQ